MGVWLAVRIDQDDAGLLCDTITGEVGSWRRF
jgi:hypothetical protein